MSRFLTKPPLKEVREEEQGKGLRLGLWLA